ncbi:MULTISPECIES: ion channel [unclassified Polaribacter]|uniref:ion channel n=1 Tax=unclassified Polaribacter TaxID=196858 RepID=UPI0011BFE166|nr:MULTISPECIES: ion channel [unclassified Polaribacter]TXD50942.1 ion transporter [Polaribacter sp. IC063]TXD62265.1 ion transporter [Polaribacter sp. IC066]
MAKKSKDPGIGHNSRENAKSVINADGSSNVQHINRKRNLNDLYGYFMGISWSQFFVLIVLVYTFLNMMFGLLYVLIGIEQITNTKGTFLEDFLNGFFFSAQTLTTVGYGGIVPKGIAANFIAVFEAMLGLLCFSFITGMLYGRFSKPKAYIAFSKNLILRDFKDQKTIMFRLMNSRKTVMIEPAIKVTLSITEKDEEGEFKRNFYELKLERSNIMYLPTVWTIVHNIDTESPLFEYSKEAIKKLNAHLYIVLHYHEKSFSQVVYQIYSYNFADLITDVKYKQTASFDAEGYTVLDHETLSAVEKNEV